MERTVTVREQVLQQAMALPAQDRAFLADQLDQSLDLDHFASPDIADAWTAAIDRRIEAYERGEVLSSEADESISRMRAYLKDHCARRTTRCP